MLDRCFIDTIESQYQLIYHKIYIYATYDVYYRVSYVQS